MAPVVALAAPARALAISPASGGMCEATPVTYVLGTDTERIGFDGTRARYTPHGQRHAVDLDDGQANTPAAVLGYALCGQPVRAWPEQRFDADAPDAHPACAALAQPQGQHHDATRTRMQRPR